MSQNNRFVGGRFRETQEHLKWQDIHHINRQRTRNQSNQSQIISTGPSYDISEVLPPLEWAFGVERLKTIVDDLAKYKGQAAGPDGVHWHDVTQAGRYAICRIVNELVISGSYRPGAIRKVSIPKSKGGTRTLNIKNIADRLVATVISKILTCLVDKHFVSTSYAYRPKMGTYDLLIQLSYLVDVEHKCHTITLDFNNAFDNVPIDLILAGLPEVGVIAANVPGEDAAEREQILGQWIKLIENVLRGAAGKSVGITQGCPLSPVAMNIFGHLNHDLVCQHIAAGVTALRYSDDMIYLSDSEDQLVEFHKQISEHIQQFGFSFKGGNQHSDSNPRSTNIVDTPLETMGFVVSMSQDSNLRYEIPESGYLKLTERLREIHCTPNPIQLGTQTLEGWIKARGPAFSPNCRDAIGVKILSSLEELCLEDSLSPESCYKLMQDSYSVWEQKRQQFYTRHRATTAYQTTQVTASIPSTLPEVATAPQSLIFENDDSCPF